jgi:hypothetical protein
MWDKNKNLDDLTVFRKILQKSDFIQIRQAVIGLFLLSGMDEMTDWEKLVGPPQGCEHIWNRGPKREKAVTSFYICTPCAILSVCDTQKIVNSLQCYHVKILFLKRVSYLKENTSHLDYRDKSVSGIERNKLGLFWDPNEPTNIPYESKMSCYLKSKQSVHMVTTTLHRVNR